MNEHVREDMIDEMEPQQVADLAAQLDTDDAVAIIEDMEEHEQRAVLRAMEPDDRAAVEEALTYPEETAGRLMQRDLIAVPEHWSVGQVIDYLRKTQDLADDFWEVFVVSPDHHPVGTCKLSSVLRSPRSLKVADIMVPDQTLIPVDMDQEDVAFRFQKYALVSAAVVDTSGRLVGMITVDDVVHIIQEEAGEDVLLLSGAGDGDINEPIVDTYKKHIVNAFRFELSRVQTPAVRERMVSGLLNVDEATADRPETLAEVTRAGQDVVRWKNRVIVDQSGQKSASISVSRSGSG